MKHYGVCPKCGVEKELTRHHLLPVRWFKRKGQILLICRLCHNDLEKLIPYKKVNDVMFYYKIVVKFLNGGK